MDLNEFQDPLDEFADTEETAEDNSSILGRMLSGAIGGIQGIASLPSELYGMARHPINTSKSALAGTLGIPGNIGLLPKALDEEGLREKFGLAKDYQEGEQLASMLFPGAGAAKAVKYGVPALKGLGKVASQALAGGAAFGTQSALQGGDWAEGFGGGALAGVPVSTGPVRNWVRNRARNTNLSPEDIAVRREQYGDSPVDLGTILGDSGLQQAYRFSEQVPGGGATFNQRQQVSSQQADRALDARRAQLDEAKSKIMSNYEAEKNVAMNQDLAHLAVKSMAQENPMDVVTKGIKGAYEKVRKESNALYDKVGGKDIDLSSALRGDGNMGDMLESKVKGKGKASLFSGYKGILNELLKSENALTEMMGENTSTAPGLKAELERGKKLISGSGPVSLDSLLQHIKNMRDYETSLKKSSSEQGQRHINRLNTALKKDTIQALRKMGHADIADALEAADKHHGEHRAPFYNIDSIKELVKDKKSNSVNRDLPGLAKELLLPENHAVFDKLPKEAQDALIHSLVTGEKLNISGKDLIGRFNRLKSHEREKISKSHPEIHGVLDRVSRGEDAFGGKSKGNKRFASALKSQLGEYPEPVDALNKLDREFQDYRENDYIKSKETKSHKAPAFLKAGGYAGLLGGAAMGHPVLAAILGGSGSAASALLGARLRKHLTDTKILDELEAPSRKSLIDLLTEGK